MTLTIDFMVLPKVFSVVKDIFLGGRIGRGLFTAFNYCEMTFSGLLLILIFTMVFPKIWQKRAAIASAISLALITLLYEFYLTPGIINATNTLESIPLDEVERRAPVFLNHQFFHQWYIRADSLKILLLLFLMVLLMIKNDQVSDKDQV